VKAAKHGRERWELRSAERPHERRWLRTVRRCRRHSEVPGFARRWRLQRDLQRERRQRSVHRDASVMPGVTVAGRICCN